MVITDLVNEINTKSVHIDVYTDAPFQLLNRSIINHASIKVEDNRLIIKTKKEDTIICNLLLDSIENVESETYPTTFEIRFKLKGSDIKYKILYDK